MAMQDCWNYLLSVNLGEYVFEDVEVKFGGL